MQALIDLSRASSKIFGGNRKLLDKSLPVGLSFKKSSDSLAAHIIACYFPSQFGKATRTVANHGGMGFTMSAQEHARDCAKDRRRSSYLAINWQ
jgi:hypothetical protein